LPIAASLQPPSDSRGHARQADRAQPVASESAAAARKLRRDLKVLISFVTLYCRSLHCDAEKTPFELARYPIPATKSKPPQLCADCRRLLAHAIVKRTHCQLDPKPACKKCPVHCYSPDYRDKMREVMRYSGRKLVLSGRLDYLWRLLF
jgi:hypothetical protein